MRGPELIAFMETIAREAGAILAGHFGRLDGDAVDFKGKRDLVTVADREAEALLTRRIRAHCPGHSIVAEEEGTTEGSDGTWFVDPLDGTTNFVHGIPVFAVSLGFVAGGVMEAGVVHAPLLSETYTAVRGGGAFRNGRTIRVSMAADVSSALLATGFAYRLEELPDDNVSRFAHLVRRARGIRRFGAASLDFAWVADGRFDAFWELHLSPWDVAAGALLVEEAGGRVTDFAGGTDWLLGRRVLASNGALHGAMLAELARGAPAAEA